MGSIGDSMSRIENVQMENNDREEKILVLVRLRPLNEKEISSNETSDWECINDTTVLYRNTLREGSTYPSAYSFDRVFRGDCSTRQVYNEGVKEVALSVVRGINSCVFAYGQTSSGKTYTMMGITEYTVSDIFDYMATHRERAFILKFSAIEIYNEAIRDLLSSDTTALRLLDDQEKGTVVERITEEPLRDWSHLQELLSICEAQRKIGETSLNEKSSRSHQILKLTIESSSREFLNKESSATLSASVNFVDLAGSERASQASSSGTRLKEGCHINRSLLTLGTVIRKLSKGGRQGHINYRDSKLTRLLQPALGGNSRTAIICTMSQARAHVEQTRNTLLFACCAKEVSTKSQVNVVMSDKALVKHLQREVARLENELRSPALPSSDGELLKLKDAQIQKMEREIAELTSQRDLAEARVQDLLRIVGHEKDDNVSITDSYLSTCANTPLHFSFRNQPIEEESNGYCKEVEIDKQCESTSKLHDEERGGGSQNGVVGRENGSPESPERGRWIVYDNSENGRMTRSFSKSSLGSAKADEEIPTVQAFVAELKDMADEEYGRNRVAGEESIVEIETKRKAIIRLWEACHVSLIHRTYFYLLIKGERSDWIYVEVEHKRLVFLREKGWSERKLKRERAMLSKLMSKRLTEEERQRLYGEWGIDVNSKQRRQQLAAKLWSAADDGDHLARSAALVAKLVRFPDQGPNLQGMFAFTFTPAPPSSRRRSLLWSFSRSSFL